MTTVTPSYGSKVTMTITLASLASDSSLAAGRESTAVDNKDTDQAVDALVGGIVTTGTTPTASRQVEVWAYGSYDDTNFSGGATGSDANLSPGEKTLMRLLTIIPTSSSSNISYKWGPFSVARAFDGAMPVQWGIFIVQNTGAALNATGGNHEVEYYPIKYTSA